MSALVEWRAVEGFSDYEVSNDGRVRSWKNNKHGRSTVPRVLRPTTGRLGRQCVTLSQGGRQKSFKIHGLVAAAFIGPRPRNMEVCHGDGNPRNNVLSNLRYDTSKQNSADSQRHGRQVRGESVGNAQLTEVLVREIRLRRSQGQSVPEICRELGTSLHSTYKAARGLTWGWVA